MLLLKIMYFVENVYLSANTKESEKHESNMNKCIFRYKYFHRNYFSVPKINILAIQQKLISLNRVLFTYYEISNRNSIFLASKEIFNNDFLTEFLVYKFETFVWILMRICLSFKSGVKRKEYLVFDYSRLEIILQTRKINSFCTIYLNFIKYKKSAFSAS